MKALMFNEMSKMRSLLFLLWCNIALEGRGATGEIITSAQDLWEGSTLRGL